MERFDLDDMLRNGLSGPLPDARFEFKEAYWLQAQALLDADARKRKRRRALAYTCVLTLLLIPATVLYMNWRGTASVPQPPAPTAAPNKALSPAMATAPNAATTPTTATEQAQYGTRNLYKNSTTQTTQNNLSESIEQDKANPKIPTTTRKNSILQGNSNLSDIFPLPQNNPMNVSNPVPDLAVPEHATIFYKPDVPTNPENAVQRTVMTAPGLLPSPIALPIGEGQALSAQSFLLPMAIPAPITKKHQDKFLEWGVVASVSTPSSLFTDEKPGFAVGANARYKLNKRLYVNADLLWRRWKGNDNAASYDLRPNPNVLDSNGIAVIQDIIAQDIVSNTNATQYGFGYFNTQTIITAKEIHQLELPLSIQYQWRKFALETGLNLSAKIVKKVTAEQYQSSSLDNAARNVLNDQYYEKYTSNKRFQTAIVGGIHWQPLQHWRIGCRVNWNTSPNSKLNYNEFSDIAAQPAQTIYLSPARSMTAEIRAAFTF